MAAVRIPPRVMEKEFLELDLESLKDDSLGVFRDTARLLDDFGFYKGDVMEEWIEGVLCRCTGVKKITFQQVFDKYGSELYITRVNLSKLRTGYLSVNTSPDMPVSKAIRHSTSIPLVSKAPRTPGGDVIIDGGIGDGHPSDLFDDPASYNKKTTGLKIMSPTLEHRDKLGHGVDNIVDFIGAFLIFQTVLIERLKIKKGYWERTISLDSPDRSIQDFAVSQGDKLNDIKKGMFNTVVAVAKYIDLGHF